MTAPPHSSFRRNLRGIAAIVASQLGFLFNDVLIKLVSERLPLGEIIFLRGVFACVFIGALTVALGQHRWIHLLADRLVGWRIVGEMGGTFFYLIALFKMPIGNAMIIFQAVPLAVTAGAALFLREPVGWGRWAAILAGFFGVLVVIRPGLTGFDAFGLLVLASVLFVSMRDVVTRAMSAAIPALGVSLATAVAITFMGALIGTGEAWSVPGWLDLASLAAAGALLAVGYFTAIVAMRLGELSVTAPFRYSAVVFAIAIGFLVWGDVPDAVTVLGSGVIVAAGLYTLYHEAKASP